MPVGFINKHRPTADRLVELMAIWRRCKEKAEREQQWGMLVLATEWVQYLERIERAEAV